MLEWAFVLNIEHVDSLTIEMWMEGGFFTYALRNSIVCQRWGGGGVGFLRWGRFYIRWKHMVDPYSMAIHGIH